MKLNKIEKIIIAVILLGLILVGGTILFVVPSYKQIETNTKTLASNLKEKEELDEKLSRLDTIDADIASQKQDALKYEGGFYPDLTTYETSEIAMAYLKSFNLEAHEISVTSLSTTGISLEYYVPSEIWYDLKTYSNAARDDSGDETLLEGEFLDGKKKYSVRAASPVDVTISDENGEEVAPSKYTDTMQKYYKAAVCKLAANDKISQTVAVASASYKIKGKYGDYVKFVDHIYSLGRATTFTEIKYPMTITIEEEKDSENMYTAEDGTLVTGSDANGKETAVTDDTEIEQDITISFLCVEPMDSLKTLDIEGTEIVVDQRPAAY